MTQDKLNKALEFLKHQVEKLGVIPGQILMKANAFVENLSKYASFSNKDARLLANILLVNRLIELDSLFIKLTPLGYSLINGENNRPLVINLADIMPINLEKQSLDMVFYQVWDVIGNNKENNPYYVDGKTFYNTIKDYIAGLPPSYNAYTKDLHEKGESTSRFDWCKALFCKLDKKEVLLFLNSLSVNINSSLSIQNNSSELVADEFDISRVARKEEFKINKDIMDKRAKIFISHSADDREYANALVQLLINIGIDEEQCIFCSSLPGCGVEFGKSFIDAIREQYENNKLIMLFIHSPRYYMSHVSLCEMGAAWIMKSEHRSFLTADCEFSMLDAVIPPTEIAFKAGQKNTYHLLNDFKEYMEKEFGLTPKSTNRWDTIKENFIKSVEIINNKTD